MIKKLLIAFSALALVGCSSGLGMGGVDKRTYRIAKVKEYKVGTDRMAVTPPREWNRQRERRSRYDLREVEDWTLNGPMLDSISFVTGLRDGKSLVYQRRKEFRQVPRFDATMTSFDIVSMLESFYRARAGALQFEQLGLEPRRFMGYPGFQWDYEYLGGNELWNRGRVVGAVIDERLYLIVLDGARQHYFENALPDFEAMVESARLVG